MSEVIFLRYLLTSAGSSMLKKEEKRALLQIARDAVRTHLQNSKPGPEREPSAGPGDRAGVFVTVRLHGKLRGCVGLIETERPLTEEVGEIAKKAAFEDPRFPPMTSAEVESAEFEVSILSRIQPLKTIDDIEVGLHGLIVESGIHRGLLLPQVAREYGWDRQELVNALLQKAGLPPSAAEELGTRFYAFVTERVTEGEGELA